jgi:hypothetical protein
MCEAFAPDANSLVVQRRMEATSFWIAVRLRLSGQLDVGAARRSIGESGDTCQTVLTTEDAKFAADAVPQGIRMGAAGPIVDFARPGAAVFRFSNIAT